jgi:thiamine biosynthesis lipoprotein
MTTTLPPRHVHVEHVLGTVVSLDVRGARTTLARRATAELAAWLHDVDRGFSTRRDDGARALDPAAFVKGWAVQRGAELLRREGLTDFALNAGGDIVVRGGALPDPAWRVGIQHPDGRGVIALSIAVTDMAVATADSHERGRRALDPRADVPSRGVVSVTVVGPDLRLADAYATAAVALGLDGPAWTLGLGDYEAMTILAGDQVLLTPGFPIDDAA